MAPTAHSAFPASASARLLACPGSFSLGQACDTGERKSTVFSAEGTLAHSLSEAAIHAGVDVSSQIGRSFTADGFEFTPDEDYAEAVAVYVDFIRSLQAVGYEVQLETRVSPAVQWPDLPDLGIELFGTADCIAYHPQTHKLVIVDLKFGKGIAVEAQDNTQFLYYAAGALGFVTGPVSEVETIVVQPRAYHPDGPIRWASYTPAEVMLWARTTLYDGVKKALRDGGKTLVPGDHCRFCPALAHCPAAEQLAHDTAVQAFANAPLTNVQLTNGNDTTLTVPTLDQQLAALPDAHLSDQKLGELLDKIAVLKPYFAALEALGEERIKQARPVPGWKLVPTRTKRVWADDEPSIISAMHNAGIAPGNYTETRLRSPAQTEKMLGKAKFKALMDQLGLVKQSEAGTTLAPEGDPRARIKEGRTAQEAFGIAPPEPTMNESREREALT